MPNSGTPKVYLVHRPSSVQTTLYVGTQGLTRTNADYTSLAVANRVLGGVMPGQSFTNRGACCVSLVDPGAPGQLNHDDCYNPSLQGVLTWFETLRQ